MLARPGWSATVGQATFEPDDEPDELDDEPDEPDEDEPEPEEDEAAAWLAFLSSDDPESPEPDPPEPDSDFAPPEPLAAARLVPAPFWLLRLSVR
jgi:hypothetical protein